MSCKIIRSDEHLFLGWLDAPEHKGDSARIMVARCDPETGEPNFITQVGAGIDNHCGPALAYDPHRKRLHVITGAHHGPFEHFVLMISVKAGFWSRKLAKRIRIPV